MYIYESISKPGQDHNGVSGTRELWLSEAVRTIVAQAQIRLQSAPCAGNDNSKDDMNSAEIE